MSYSEDNTFEKIMSRMLSNERLENVDKREGSMIYDAIAPCAMELAEAYAIMDILQEQTYLMTATGSNLDKKAYDYGISRIEATKAQRIATFKKYLIENGEYVLDENNEKILVDMDIPIGSRFFVPENQNIIFEYIGVIDGYKILQCESEGTGGNEHIGIVLPLVTISELVESKITSTYKYGEDEETDDNLRERIRKNLIDSPFGGNISDYINRVNAIDGVGNTKVFPAWQQNGSVLLSIVDPTFNPVSNEFIQRIKNQIDPEENTGEGVGIAPIGHYVTVTTPVKTYIDVTLVIDFENGYTVEQIQEDVENKLAEYFYSVRSTFGQDVNLSVYRARIIEKVLELPYVLNVTDVLLNNQATDIVLEDEGLLNKQYLPYLGGVTIE